MAQDQETIFREIQRFRQPVFWFLLVAVCVSLLGVVSYAMVRQLVLGKAVGNSPISDMNMLVFGSLLISMILGFPALIMSVRLVTEVRQDGLYFGFFPFQRSLLRVEPHRLAKFQMRAFNSVAELRTWKDKVLDRSRVLTVSGNYGVHLELDTGESWFLGTQQPEQLFKAILKAFKIPGCRKIMEPRADTDQHGLKPGSEIRQTTTD